MPFMPLASALRRCSFFAVKKPHTSVLAPRSIAAKKVILTLLQPVIVRRLEHTNPKRRSHKLPVL
mgnify:CR=1 FL=1